MRKTILAALAAATALSAPAFAQRPTPTAPATIAPEVVALRDAALSDTVAYDIVEPLSSVQPIRKHFISFRQPGKHYAEPLHPPR